MSQKISPTSWDVRVVFKPSRPWMTEMEMVSVESRLVAPGRDLLQCSVIETV